MLNSKTAAFPPAFRLTEMMLGLWVPQALHAAAELGVADALGGDARGSDELAASVGANGEALHRLLRALVVLEVCAETEDGRFRLTPLGDCLRSDSPDSVRSWALLMGAREVWRVWGRLADSVRTGEHVWKMEGTDPFTWLQKNPEEGAIFNQAMFEVSQRTARAVIDAYDFSPFRNVVDVGGGYGTVLAAILVANPGLKGVVFDLAHCRDGAHRLIESRNLENRAEFRSGDFFEGVPQGGDLYILKSVIHDWNDERSLAILQNVRSALGDGGRLLVIEGVAPDRIGSSPFDDILVASDLNMMVNTGGRERTEGEYRKLFGNAGLRIERIVPTPSAMRIIQTAAS